VSHYLGIVIGDNIREQLAPYNEQDENYFSFCPEVDTSNREELYVWLKKQLEIDKSLKRELPIMNVDDIRRYLSDWFPEQRGSKYGYLQNPNAKWDWWTAGGRWENFFILKGDKKSHMCKKGEVDWEKMRKQSLDLGKRIWDKHVSCIRKLWHEFGLEENEPIAWQDFAGEDCSEYFFEEVFKNDENKVFTFDEFIIAMPFFAQGGNDKEIGETKEEYLSRSAKFSCWCYIRNGEWKERGKVGWWGSFTSEVDAAKWATEFDTMITNLPDDTLLTAVDFHI